MVCPLCGERKARRGCPALGHQICTLCCGQKRQIEIRCPSDCSYLASAREHPPAVIVRQQLRDLGLFSEFLRDLNPQQSRLFLLVNAHLARYHAPELLPLVDDHVVDAAAALAATFETASRGVIYEHRPSSAPAERLAAGLRTVVKEADESGERASDRDVAFILRRVEQAAKAVSLQETSNRRAFVELLGRVMRPAAEPEAIDGPRLIIP